MPIMGKQKGQNKQKQLTQFYPQKKQRTDVRKEQLKQPVASSSDVARAEDLKVLRDFDLDWRYGPCTNSTRMERWNRAVKLELDPPIIVKQLIEHHAKDEEYVNNLWFEYNI